MESCGGLRQAFVVAGEAAEAGCPGKGAFDDPAAREQDEAALGFGECPASFRSQTFYTASQLGAGKPVDIGHASPLRKQSVSHVVAKSGRLLLVLALLVSIGGHWALLQSVAWTQMLVERSQKGSLMEAVKTTFDGAHPCELCKRIANNHDEEPAPAQSLVKAKLDFIFAPQTTRLFLQAAAFEWPQTETSAQPRAEQPSLPPPRVA